MFAQKSACPGCSAIFEDLEGPTHSYMESSPACWHEFGKLLAAEYCTEALMQTHRLSVDTYAVQHPGDSSRRAIQSVGLHLARLSVQIERSMPPKETNDVMLGFSKRKATLRYLEPPNTFKMTIADVAPFIGSEVHSEKVQEWASFTWNDWCHHHDYIRTWVAER